MNIYIQRLSIQYFNNKVLLGALLAAGIMMGSGIAAAGTDTQNLAVSATISASCVFGAATTLPFGTLTISDLTNGKNETAQAAVKITCSNTGTPAKLYAAATRQMTNGTDNLVYEVYTNAGRTTALGVDATGGASVTADGTEQTITLWGKTNAGQATISPGAYTQNLSMTVEF